MVPQEGEDTLRDDILAEGEAGLFFVEALALKLIDKGLLDADEVLEAIEIARGAKEIAADEGDAPQISVRAAALLTRIMNSIMALEKLRPPVKS